MLASIPGRVISCLLAIVVLGYAASSATALTVTVRAGSGTATINNLTLSDSLLGGRLGDMTLNYSLPAGTYRSPGTVTLGTITGGSFKIRTPAGITVRLNTPFAITSTLGLLSDGSISLDIPNIGFQFIAATGALNYIGRMSFLLSRSGQTLTVSSSAIRNTTTGGTFSFLGTPAFAVAPPITFTSI